MDVLTIEPTLIVVIFCPTNHQKIIMVVLLDEIYLVVNNSTGALWACVRPLSNDF